MISLPKVKVLEVMKVMKVMKLGGDNPKTSDVEMGEKTHEKISG